MGKIRKYRTSFEVSFHNHSMSVSSNLVSFKADIILNHLFPYLPKPHPHPLSPKMRLLQRPKPQITNRSKSKSERKPHIATITRVPNMFPDRTDEPDLRHAHDGAEDAEAEGEDGGDARGEQFAVVPDGDVVLAAFEVEVLG